MKNKIIINISNIFLFAVVMLLSCTAKGDIYEKENISVISITTQPVAITNVTAGSITAILTVNASVTQSATLSYQWYNNTTNSNSDGTAITGATGANFTIPATLAVGTYYYFCEVSATGGATPVRTTVATVNVAEATGTLPVLTTNEATNIATNNATLNGNITSAGNPAYTERGFVYSTSSTIPAVEGNDVTKVTVSGNGAGAYNSSITGLTANTKYYFRAFATNSAGTAYGGADGVVFTTMSDNDILLPTVTTSEPTNVGSNSASLNGSITAAGNPAYSERGFVYTTTTNTPTIDDSNVTKVTVSGNGIGAFSASITGLTASTTYYVRTYATSPAGIAYGGTTGVSFTTISDDINGVIINGVRWATRNVAESGTFAAKPEDFGMFYQWNRKKAWAATGSVSGWDNSVPTGTTWEKANDPSPVGWRVPSLDDIQKLLDTNNVSNESTAINGVNGRKFTSKASGQSIFLPAAGYRYFDAGTINSVGSFGYYWSSSSQYGVNDANCLYFDSGSGWDTEFRMSGLSIRPIADN